MERDWSLGIQVSRNKGLGGQFQDDNNRSKPLGRSEIEGRGGKLLKKSWAYFCQVWREECENKGRGNVKKANEFLNLRILHFYRVP